MQGMIDAVMAILPERATLVSFSYRPDFFGNMVVEIEMDAYTHAFVTDRGEIYRNGKLLCGSAYLEAEKIDTFSKLLQMIEKEFSSPRGFEYGRR